jgi:hypothetical protein
MRLFRSMKEASDGLPSTGPSGKLLGVRPANMPTADVLATNPGDPVHPDQGGMSVAPYDPLHLPKHRRPASLGGTGLEPVWYIELDDLGPELQFRQDRSEHGLVEPARVMALHDLQDALARTRSWWHLYCR